MNFEKPKTPLNKESGMNEYFHTLMNPYMRYSHQWMSRRGGLKSNSSKFNAKLHDDFFIYFSNMDVMTSTI